MLVLMLILVMQLGLVNKLEDLVRIPRYRFNLHNKEHPTHINKVFITPDLTPQQQAKNKQLHARLSELAKQVRKLYRIKNGEIVLRDEA